MVWAYVLENMGLEDNRNNQNLFLLINDLEIPDDNRYFDCNLDRPELFTLLEVLQHGDRLAIRSVLDLADTLSGLISVFQKLRDKGIILCSCLETYLSRGDLLQVQDKGLDQIQG